MIKMKDKYSQTVKVVDGLRRAGLVGFFERLGRVDLCVDNERVTGTNIANDDFPSKGTLDARLSEWGLSRLKEYRKCDLCGKTKYAPPLSAYDLEEFPGLESKTVCSDCRSDKYDQLLSDLARDEKKDWLSVFAKEGRVTKEGRLKAVSINLCMFPECSCGWNITVTGAIKQVKRLGLRGFFVKENGNTLTVGGKADQWMKLGKICELAGGTIPPGYPPRLTED